MSIDPLIGKSVGPFLVERVVGRGGMAVVYLAHDARDDRSVALKLMTPELARNPEFRDRFLLESQIVVEHPNIVPVYDSGEVDGVLYISMYCVDGTDLKKAIERTGRLAPTRTVALLNQAAAGLDAAHEEGLLHRDVKPQNILLEGPEGDEHVYLSDFGLVKRLSASSFTTSTHFMGTVQYMAPEQIKGGAVDGRADVYALGCVAFECLTGAPPFAKDTEVAAMWAHMHDTPPSASAKVPVLPTTIDPVIAKAMAKDPADRYLTCGEMAGAMAQEFGVGLAAPRLWGSGAVSSGRIRKPSRTPRGTVPPRKNVRRVPAFAAGIAAALVALGLFVELTTGRGEVGTGAVSDVLQELPGAVADIGGDAEEPEPSQPADRARAVRARQIGRFGEVLPRGVPTGARRESPRISRRQPRAGAVERGPAIALPPSLATTKIVFQSSRHASGQPQASELYLMNADGTDLERLTHDDPAFHEDNPSISPDGTRIAWTSTRGSGNYNLFVMDVDGSNIRQITNTPDLWEFYPRWSPDGSRLLFTTFTAGAGYFGAGAYPDIWVVNADGGDKRNLTDSPGNYEIAGDWSPDGKKIAFDRDGHLYTMNVSGGDLRQLSYSGPGRVLFEPDWCRGGYLVASWLVDEQENWSDIVRINARTGVRRALTTANGRDLVPSCSPDGTKIAFESGRTGVRQVFVMNADGTNEVNLSRSKWDEETPSWQPTL